MRERHTHKERQRDRQRQRGRLRERERGGVYIKCFIAGLYNILHTHAYIYVI